MTRIIARSTERWSALAATVVAVTLVGSNYHFLSDVIAGSFLGGTVGVITLALMEPGRTSSGLDPRNNRSPK